MGGVRIWHVLHDTGKWYRGRHVAKLNTGSKPDSGRLRSKFTAHLPTRSFGFCAQEFGVSGVGWGRGVYYAEKPV